MKSSQGRCPVLISGLYMYAYTCILSHICMHTHDHVHTYNTHTLPAVPTHELMMAWVPAGLRSVPAHSISVSIWILMCPKALPVCWMLRPACSAVGRWQNLEGVKLLGGSKVLGQGSVLEGMPTPPPRLCLLPSCAEEDRLSLLHAPTMMLCTTGSKK